MRIYPNSAQRNQLWQTFGCVRFVWNQMLNMQIERRKNNPVIGNGPNFEKVKRDIYKYKLEDNMELKSIKCIF